MAKKLRFRPRLGDLLAAIGLCALPALLFIEPLRDGAIPWFMDTLMYFVPLRVHAARLLAGGDWPLWNRCLMGGVPLFENPQAALAYPGHWPFLLRPGAFWFTFPLLAHLGLWAALTGWAARRLGAGRIGALFAGGLALAGSYGWSRLQYGNYLNVLPWWPLWLGAAYAFAAGGGALWLAAGAAAVALSILAGAHQLAAYGWAGLFVYAVVQIVLGGGGRGRWLTFLVFTFCCGLVIGAPGWLPQIAYLRETPRPAGLEPGPVLAGTIGSWGELARALAGDWNLMKLKPGEPWADAESSAAIGLAALALAAIIPRRRAARRAWLGCWAAALLGIAFSLRAVMEPLLRVLPQAGIFHDPRRWLGLSQWMLILAAALGAGSMMRKGPQRRKGLKGLKGLGGLILFYVPSSLLVAGMAVTLVQTAPRYTAINFSLVLLLVTLLPLRCAAARVLFAAGLAAALGLLGHATWVTTDLKTFPLDRLLDPRKPPLIVRAGLNPGQRFFTMDWQRSASYDYARPDLADWALPNLACLWGMEDLGGYEPAQSVRYRAFMDRLHAGQSWSRSFIPHFGLIDLAHLRSEFDSANVRAAILPRWGARFYFGRAAYPDCIAIGYPRGLARNIDVRALVLDGDTSARLQFKVTQGPEAFVRPTTPPRPLTPADDLAAPEGVYAGPRPDPPAGGHLLAAAADLPPLLSEFTRSYPPTLLLEIPQRERLVGAYYWNADLAALWQPLRMGRIATLMRYRGEPAWTAWAGGTGEVLTAAIAPNRLDLDVRVTSVTEGGGARLIVHDAYWPGWRATVDGQPALVRPAGLWRAIDLPAGEHKITMSYAPPGVPLALWICAGGAALLLMSVLIVHFSIRQRRKGQKNAKEKP